jgi:RNA polymerase sigma factor (sigma-70 family)
MEPQTLNSTDDLVKPQSDGDLLRRFSVKADPGEFAELMRRHGGYILGVCQRVTCHAQDAEDVFQACFLQLVRRPASIIRRDSVVGWLHTVAVRLSLKSRARRQQRQQHEVTGPMNYAVARTDDVSWREVRQILEEELAQLPDALRSVVITCLLEGHTQDEAARMLSLKLRTIKDRLRRGRELLRVRLTRRGFTLSVVGALLSCGNAEATVPASLSQSAFSGATAIVNKSQDAGRCADQGNHDPR